VENSKSKVIRDLRVIGIAEGISFLVLLLIAMPIKYVLGNPLPVKYTGWVHGILFIAYVFAVLRTAWSLKWNLKRTALFQAASLVPLATFILDKNLKKEQAELSFEIVAERLQEE
jgi:integral membrane protein